MAEGRWIRRMKAAEVLEDGTTGSQTAYRVNRAVARTLWSQLGPFQTAWITRIASDMRLSILHGDLVWKDSHPHVTFRGLRYLLNRHPQFDSYQVEPAPERVRRAMCAGRQSEALWMCRLWRKDRGHPAVGYGQAAETEAQHVNLAQERAVRQAAEIAFGWPPVCPQEAHRPRSDHDVSGWPSNGSPGYRTAPAEVERLAVWSKIAGLMAQLPTKTPRQVCAWFQREYSAKVREEELAALTPPGKLSTQSPRRLAASLNDYRTHLLGEG